MVQPLGQKVKVQTNQFIPCHFQKPRFQNLISYWNMIASEYKEVFCHKQRDVVYLPKNIVEKVTILFGRWLLKFPIGCMTPLHKDDTLCNQRLWVQNHQEGFLSKGMRVSYS